MMSLKLFLLETLE